MSIVLQAEIVIPEGMGRAEALAKVCASLQTLIAERCRFWRTGRADVAVFGPQVENRPACTLYVLPRGARLPGSHGRRAALQCLDPQG